MALALTACGALHGGGPAQLSGRPESVAPEKPEFTSIDANADGSIDGEEFGVATRQLFVRLDEDGDLSEAEYAPFLPAAGHGRWASGPRRAAVGRKLLASEARSDARPSPEAMAPPRASGHSVAPQEARHVRPRRDSPVQDRGA